MKKTRPTSIEFEWPPINSASTYVLKMVGRAGQMIEGESVQDGLKFCLYQTKYILNKFVPLRLRKAGRVWCGGARETHLATYHREVTPSKIKDFLKCLPFFKYLW